MKQTILFLLIVLFGTFGCMKSNIRDSLNAHHPSNQSNTLAILPVQVKDEKFARCVQNELKEDLQNLRVIPGDRFRDALFPWFEPSTAPDDTQELMNLLNKNLVRERIENFGVEILIFIQGTTDQSDLEGPVTVVGGFGAAGALGYQSAERTTRILVKVWDLKNQASLGDADVHIKGEFRMPYVIIPIPIPVFTESSACSETAKRISNVLSGNGSDVDQ